VKRAAFRTILLVGIQFTPCRIGAKARGGSGSLWIPGRNKSGPNALAMTYPHGPPPAMPTAGRVRSE
jgi:hypothetical protein